MDLVLLFRQNFVQTSLWNSTSDLDFAFGADILYERKQSSLLHLCVSFRLLRRWSFYTGPCCDEEDIWKNNDRYFGSSVRLPRGDFDNKLGNGSAAPEVDALHFLLLLGLWIHVPCSDNADVFQRKKTL